MIPVRSLIPLDPPHVQAVIIWGVLTALGFLLLLACIFASMVLAVLDSLPEAGTCCAWRCLTAGRVGPVVDEGGGGYPASSRPSKVMQPAGHYPPPAQQMQQQQYY